MTFKTPATRAPRHPDSQQIVFRLLPDEIKKADQYSAQEERSRSAFIRLIFLRGLAEYERQHGHNG